MIEKKFLDEATKRIKIKEFIKKELEKAGIVDVIIQRTPISTRIGVIAERPGLVIGKKGKSIQDLAKQIEEQLKIENPQIEVVDVQDPSQDPNVIARWIKRMLEKGMKPKRILIKAAERVMHSGAIGVELIIKGTVSKGKRSRKERLAEGYIKKAGDSVKLVRKAQEQVILKQGVLGITVKIVPRGTVFPDKIIIEKKEEPKETAIQDLAIKTMPTPEETKAAEEVQEKAHETITQIAKEAKKDKPTEKLEKKAAKTVEKEAVKEATEEKPKKKKAVKKKEEKIE